MTSGYVPLSTTTTVFTTCASAATPVVRFPHHPASLPPSLPARLPAWLRATARARSISLARSPARFSSSSSCSSREIYIFLIRFSFFWSFYNLLDLSFFFVLEKNSLRRNFFFGFLHSLKLHAFPFLASFASASSWLPFSFSVFSLFLTWVCNCFVPSVVETG